MTALSTRTLSKSDFTLARGCETKLHFRENRFPESGDSSPYVRLLADGGYMVDALAQAQRPDGILLDYGRGPDVDAAKTREYLERDTVTLFQATLLGGRRLARVDIIEKRGNVVRLIEVKAKSFDGAEHAADLARGGVGIFRTKRAPHTHLVDWAPKFEDLTFQVLLFERLFPNLTVQPVLELVDKGKRTTLDGVPRFFEIERHQRADGSMSAHAAHFTGTADDVAKLDVLTEVDATADIAMLRAEVDAEANRLEALLDAPFDRTLVTYGTKCAECEFRGAGSAESTGFARCWGELASVKPHLLELYQLGRVTDAAGTPLVETLPKSGKASLFDIPEERLRKKDGTFGPLAERQLRQLRQTRSGERWIGPALLTNVASLNYPLHFIDFEVTRLALPYHAEMRPYGQVTFQWSCHTVSAPGAVPVHREWLNADDAWPNVTFGETLRDAIGDRDTVVVWSPFEGSRLNELKAEHANFVEYDAQLAAWIDGLVNGRIVDTHKWAANDFYHPGMRGRTSIKVVLDALWKDDASMREQFTTWTGRTVSATGDPYHALPPIEIDGVVQDVREGTGAMRAYEAMMYGVEKNDPDAKAKWRQLLRQYCELDTLSMVLIFEYWRRLANAASP